MRSVIVSLHYCVWICGLLLSLFIIVSGYVVCYCLSSLLCLDMWSVIVSLYHCLDMRSVNVFSRKGYVCMYCNAYNACNWPFAHGSRLRITIRSITFYSSGNQYVPCIVTEQYLDTSIKGDHYYTTDIKHCF